MSREEKGIQVAYEDFLNMHFRIGEIVACEEIKNSLKLLNFKVNLGEETIQIVSGLREYYDPEEVIGKKVTVLCNLKPITMGGLPSEGVILSAEDSNGNLAFVVPERDILVGAEVC
ncbi:methionyl-tRNA synthetase C-terminal region/beta chain [Lachnospiraceae bacterium XBB1006]|nr:methionyl-tRNA synthetase C-terminal region/beta chain [Lachnospiraceae bacterium XBB1006]